jgi:hypothetical protein
MNNLSQPPQPTEPDMALLYLGSLFETLDYTLPPERDEAKLDALAWHILDKRPKTLLGLAIRARAEKHLCRYLWTVDFERLPPSDQAARVVIECAMLLSSRPCDRGEFRAQSKTPPGDRGPTGFCAWHNKRIIRTTALSDSDGIGEQLAGSESSPDRGGKVVGLDGPPLPKRVAITEWDSLEQAEAFFKSKAWTDLGPDRDKAIKTIRQYAVEAVN